MTETWPAPELRERQHGLGWLALSASNDVIHIGVTAPTAAEAAELYEQKRQYWAALAQD
jgi:hypothetical protein